MQKLINHLILKKKPLMAASAQIWPRSCLRHFSVSPGHTRSSEFLIVLEDEGKKRITMCDSRTRNALSLGMMQALRAEINSCHKDTRCIIISAEGPVFSAGHNLKQLSLKHGKNPLEQIFRECSNLMLDIRKIPLPVISEIKGLAAAAGCQLVAASDIAVASQTAKFSTPGVNFGLFCSTPGILLTRAVPLKAASYMLFTGNPISATDALNHGLVSRVVEEACLEVEVNSIADSIIKKSKSVIARGKKFLYQQISLELEEALKLGEKEMVDNLCMRDGQEGIAGFANKRPPSWKHDDSLAEHS